MNEHQLPPAAEQGPRELLPARLRKLGSAITAVAVAGGLYLGFGRGDGTIPDQAPDIECVMTVKPGDTLWDIATDTLPGNDKNPVDTQNRVNDIRVINRLPNNAITVGEELGLSSRMCENLDTSPQSWRE